MKQLTDKQVNDIANMGKEVQGCIYAKSGREVFKVVDARHGTFSIVDDKELNHAIISCIKENLPTMRSATKDFFENEVLPSLYRYKE